MTDKERNWLEKAIEALALTARKEGEYWRAGYTREDACGADLLKKWMLEKGFQTRFDSVGNLYGRIEGRSKETILIGSHRDTVKNGGKYDGVLGILAGIEAVASLFAEKGRPQKTVEVVAMCEEEASRFLTGYVGSRAIVGGLGAKNLQEQDDGGMTLIEAMTESGYYKGELPQERRDVSRFLELHIEQGGILENQSCNVGIVTSIAGIFAGEVMFYGQQNHAGTTPMRLRKDPVPAAAQLIQALSSWAEEKEESLTCTFGNMTVEPGKSNVIADKVALTFDIRSGCQSLLTEAEARLRALAAADKGVKTEIHVACQDPPAMMDAGGVASLEALAAEKKIPYLKMNSGAGHDSQIIAAKIKTNMIFVPSRDGISHSPLEFTSMDDLQQGYDLLKAFVEMTAW